MLQAQHGGDLGADEVPELGLVEGQGVGRDLLLVHGLDLGGELLVEGLADDGALVGDAVAGAGGQHEHHVAVDLGVGGQRVVGRLDGLEHGIDDLLFGQRGTFVGQHEGEAQTGLAGAEHDGLLDEGALTGGALELQRVGLLAVVQGQRVVEAAVVLPGVGERGVAGEAVLGGVGAVRAVGGDLGRPARQAHALVQAAAAVLEAQERLDVVGGPQVVPAQVVARAERRHQLARLGGAVVADQVDAARCQLVAQRVRARRAAEHDDLEARQQLEALVVLGQQVQHVRHAVEDLEVVRLDDVDQVLLGQRQLCVVQVDLLARVDGAEQRADAVGVEQRQRDEAAHVHVGRVVFERRPLRLEDGLRQPRRPRRVDDPRHVALLLLHVELVVHPRVETVVRFRDGVAVDLGPGNRDDAEVGDVVPLECRRHVGERRVDDHVSGVGCVQQRRVCLLRDPCRLEHDRVAEFGKCQHGDEVLEIRRPEQANDRRLFIRARPLRYQSLVHLCDSVREYVELARRVVDILDA